MLDTNICIYMLKNYPRGLRHRFEQQQAHLCISSITLGELQYGVEKSTQRERSAEELDLFAGRLETLSFTAEAARHYGELRAVLERAGTPVGIHDLLIGAHARSEGITLVTNNRREFDRVPGLSVENWVA
jgi:tRNA(fMet)-specific endonuclease VapC